MNATQRQQISKAVRDAAPTSSYGDCQPDRYRVWMSDDTVVKGRTKAELRVNLALALADGKTVAA